MQVNLLPFIIEAIASNKLLYKDIDRLYQANKYEYHKLAKESDLYSHQMIKEGSLLQEEYSKKTLGILLGAGQDEKMHEEIQKMIWKGYRYACVYLERNSRIYLDKFTKAFIKKHKGFKDVQGNSIELHVVVLVFLTVNSQSTLIKNEFHDKFINDLNERWNHYNDTDDTRISIHKANDTDKGKIKQLKQDIYNKYGDITNYDSILAGNFDENKLDLSSFLFDYENLSSISIFESIQFTDKDIDEILYLYVIANRDLKDIFGATSFLISHMYNKYLIKAYKQVKDMYFANNKETMYVELEGLERQIKALQGEIKVMEDSREKLASTNKQLEIENNRLKNELRFEKRNREELNSLREFMFNLDNQEGYAADRDFNLDELKGYKAIIIGGHEKWQQRMKELLPNFIFIHPDNLNFDVRLLKDIDIVFIYTNYLNHGLYYKVMGAIAGKDVKVAYINQQNEDKVLRTIYQKIKTLG